MYNLYYFIQFTNNNYLGIIIKVIKMNQKKRIKKIKVRRIKLKKLFFTLVLFSLIIFLLIKMFNQKIKNIYVTNNTINAILKEQYIIDVAGINNYPSLIKVSSIKIKEKLKNNIFIKNVNVYRKGLYTIYIEIIENSILFYNSSNNTYVLEDKNEITYNDIMELYPKLITHIPSVPTLVNYVPENIYNNLIEQMSSLDDSILNHISEIRYVPNNVDQERFLFTMNDGNYVYITPSRMNLMNKYLDIVTKVDNKKGTLFLDYGIYFVFE